MEAGKHLSKQTIDKISAAGDQKDLPTCKERKAGSADHQGACLYSRSAGPDCGRQRAESYSRYRKGNKYISRTVEIHSL